MSHRGRVYICPHCLQPTVFHEEALAAASHLSCDLCNSSAERSLWKPLVRPGDQPLPIVNDLPAMQNLVWQDIEARKTIGLQRYGTLLQPHNGRDFLRDAYEEALDMVMYLRGALYERDGR